MKKKVICAGLSSRQSGLIHSANSSSLAALMASDATDMWINIEKYWGVTSNYLQTGAIWIGAKPNALTELGPWKNISNNMKALNIDFEEIDSVGVKSLSNEDILTNENERYFYEPKAIQLDVSSLTESINDAIMLTNVDVYESTEINEISCDENEISHISTNKGIFESSKIINAAGALGARSFFIRAG